MAQDKLVNGEKPHSVTVDHLFKYPLLSQSYDFYQSQPLGAKSLDILNSVYARTSPLLATPASYIAPYAAKVDNLGDSGLQTIDTHFPIIRNTDFHDLQSYAAWPYTYLRSTYQDEWKKTKNHDGEGVVTYGKALLSTEIRILSEAAHAVGDFLGPKKDEAMQQYEQLKDMGMDKAEKAKKQAQYKKDQARDQAVEKKEQLANGTS